MSKNRFWMLFTVTFMTAGAVVGIFLAGSYVRSLGINGGRFFTLDVSALRPLSQAGKVLAQVAFAMGGLLIGFLTSTVIYSEIQRLWRGLEAMSAQDKIAGILGLVTGLVLTGLIVASFNPPTWASLLVAIISCYVGVAALLSMKEQFQMYVSPTAHGSGKTAAAPVLRPKLLDTNVIIDGRIADICKAGFVEGPIYIPRFVLDELQQIADSSDPLKRARGRRGLDILNAMQQEMSLKIQTYDAATENYPDEVDAKLVELAKDLNGAIVTNDYNLNKVAGLHGIKVLNVNELANALKPVVLPGEEMTILVIKEGKEQNQGVGYLDDGTMVVVEGGRRRVGETLDVIVTSVLQTAAGKMIFANIDEGQEEEESIERGIRSYTGSRPRKKIR